MKMAARRPVEQRVLLAFALVAVLGIGCVTTELNKPPPVVTLAESKRDLGIDHLRRGRTGMAIRELSESKKLDPEDHETQLWLGEAYRRKGRLDDAERYLLRALELASGSHATLVTLSALYIQMGRYEESIRHTETLFQDPTFSTPWRALVNRGWAQYKLGRDREARASLLEALDFHPTYWPAHLDLGILESEQGHKLEAIDRFQQVLKKKPGAAAEAEANYRIGEVLVSLGRGDKAIQHFTRAVEKAPYAPWGKQSKEYLKLLQ